MTAPDDDRLPATNSGQETHRAVAGDDGWGPTGHCLDCRWVVAGAREQVEQAVAEHTRPAPQQPPAQEREDPWCREESCQYRYWTSGSMPTHKRGTGCPAPSSETDSAGEEAVAARTLRELADHLEREHRAGYTCSTPRLVERLRTRGAALAASPGAKGGEGRTWVSLPAEDVEFIVGFDPDRDRSASRADMVRVIEHLQAALNERTQ